MPDLDVVARSCAVIVDPEAEGGFKHLATAWAVGEGEWVTIWQQDLAPSASARILVAHSGEVAPLADWEQDEDSQVAGFRSAAAAEVLTQAPEGGLTKRAPLYAVGYPSVIEHPQFNLHRPSLTTELYLPYLCPWAVDGHCCLFTVDEGFLTGRFYHGMQGGPVLNAAGEVVGMLLGGTPDPKELPLTRFLRLG